MLHYLLFACVDDGAFYSILSAILGRENVLRYKLI